MEEAKAVERKVISIGLGVSLEDHSEGDIVDSLGRKELIDSVTESQLVTLARDKKEIIYLLERDLINKVNNSSAHKIIKFYKPGDKDYDKHDGIMREAEM